MHTKRTLKRWSYAFLTVLITLLISMMFTAVFAQLNQQQNAFFVSRPDTITRVGEPYVYDIIVGGIDEGAITFTSDASWLSIVDNGDLTAQLSGVPTTTQSATVVIAVERGDNVEIVENYTIWVQESSTPAISSLPVLTATEELTYSYSISLTNIDPANPPQITFEQNPLSSVPLWLSLEEYGDGTALLSGIPDDPEVGYTNVMVSIGDFDIQTFTIDVLPVNDDPIFTAPSVPAATATRLFTMTLILSDVDQTGPLIISVLEKPEWLTFLDQGDGSAELIGTPSMEDVGQHLISLEGDDGDGGTATLQFTVIVGEIYIAYLPVAQR